MVSTAERNSSLERAVSECVSVYECICDVYMQVHVCVYVTIVHAPVCGMHVCVLNQPQKQKFTQQPSHTVLNQIQVLNCV